ncbi:hypothetical protein GMORB2_2606 [Geosmithia morbida]|uniref:CFEM domain-containing protein n=1 Tax=Geosmithia morbida TaxID=1094350 RepID=A0A9P5CYM4_9HYPO|nr:uncharacterized protein GMORB2_2606 [Geosmithia morbida]KAF4120603.1 hypothetical protein GMORB2_2606 [Geosmithia morbida]
MVSFTTLLSSMAAISIVASAETPSAQELMALKAAQESYPKCALACMAKLIPESNCTATDIECLCTNEELTAQTTVCVLGGCTLYEGLQTKNVTMTMCGAPIRDKSMQPLVIGILFGVIALIAFLLRIGAIFVKSGRLPGLDDAMILLAVLLAVPPTVFAWTLVENGLGKDMWTLTMKEIKNVLRYYYFGEIFYFASITSTKISILLFLLRVFPDQTFRRLVYAACGLAFAYGASFIVATALQCWPVEYSWQQIDESWGTGSCNNIHVQGWMSAAMNIVVDLVVLCLPLKHLWQLQMELNKKLMIMFMFSLGIFVTIISIIRLRSLVLFANTSNVTWDYTAPAWWSTLEIHLSIVCACLPSVRQLFVVLFGDKGKTTKNSYGSSKASSKRSGQESSTTETTYSQRPPKHGDEGDFVPLVDYNGNKASDKGSAYSVSVADKKGDV